ncbi:hypothetical protein SVAN01_08283 [Stagonosporopsis vannaccii]|nr:hypothetical protein SVAN01_08283 [Stagonosporopsis vannaccii]
MRCTFVSDVSRVRARGAKGNTASICGDETVASRRPQQRLAPGEQPKLIVPLPYVSGLVEPQFERSHKRKHMACIRCVWLRNREITRRTGKTGRSTLGAGCDPGPLSERSLLGDAAWCPIKASPMHENGMAIVVSAFGPCAKRLGQRGLAVTQVHKGTLR